MVQRYQQLGIALNEINRSMGLLDLVPEVIVPAGRREAALRARPGAAGRERRMERCMPAVENVSAKPPAARPITCQQPLRAETAPWPTTVTHCGSATPARPSSSDRRLHWPPQVERERKVAIRFLRRRRSIGPPVCPIGKNRATRRLSAS